MMSATMVDEEGPDDDSDRGVILLLTMLVLLLDGGFRTRLRTGRGPAPIIG